MLVFWIIAIVLLLIILALLLPALVRPNPAISVDANAEKRAIFRQQFAELEQDKADGVLDSAQYDMAKSELERRFLEEVGDTESTVVATSPDKRLAMVLLVVLPLVAGLLYYKLGSPVSISIPAVSPDITSQAKPDHSTMLSDWGPLLASLKKKLEVNPGDGAGWALLGRSYVELRQHANAIPAYEKAASIIKDDPQLLADYADALAVVNGHKLTGKPEELIMQALKLDPNHVKALMLAATVAFDRQDYKQAIVYWERLQRNLPADSEILPEIKASLNEARALTGEKVPAQPAAAIVTERSGVSGTVSISPKLISKLDPAATVFIFARAAQGQPMPLAIVRTTVSDLPYSYHLDDTNSIMPTNKLSQANEVILVARVSKTGDAKQQAGDLQGMSSVVKPNGMSVDIEIDQVLP